MSTKPNMLAAKTNGPAALPTIESVLTAGCGKSVSATFQLAGSNCLPSCDGIMHNTKRDEFFLILLTSARESVQIVGFTTESCIKDLISAQSISAN